MIKIYITYAPEAQIGARRIASIIAAQGWRPRLVDMAGSQTSRWQLTEKTILVKSDACLVIGNFDAISREPGIQLQLGIALGLRKRVVWVISSEQKASPHVDRLDVVEFVSCADWKWPSIDECSQIVSKLAAQKRDDNSNPFVPVALQNDRQAETTVGHARFV